MKRLAISLILALTLLGPLKAEPTEKVDDWLADLDAYHIGLEAGHIDLYHTISKEEFERRLDKLREQLPELSDAQIEARLMRITHAIGDGHTAMPLWGSKQARFPIEVRWIEGQAIITGITAEHSEFLGAVIERWNGRDMAEVYKRLAPYAPFVENSGSEAVRVAQYLNYAELGHAIGLGGSEQSASLDLSLNEQTKSIVLNVVDSEDFRGAVSQRLDFRKYISSEPTFVEAPGLSFALLEGDQIGYIKFDSYPDQEAMAEFGEAVYAAMDTSQAKSIVIDFRENFGGNFFIGLLLAANLVGLDAVDWREGVYVLTSGKTFSAAMSNAAQFADILNARLVGQPTGANPCGYQDTGSFRLPNSGHQIIYSKRFYCFADAVEDALQPDVLIPVTREDYIMGKDRALDLILNDIAGRTSVNEP